MKAIRLELGALIAGMVIGCVVLGLSFAIGKHARQENDDEDFWSLILHTPEIQAER